MNLCESYEFHQNHSSVEINFVILTKCNAPVARTHRTTQARLGVIIHKVNALCFHLHSIRSMAGLTIEEELVHAHEAYTHE